MNKKLIILLLSLFSVSALANMPGNILKFGDRSASTTKQIVSDQGLGSTNPRLRYNHTTSKWEFSNDGSGYAAVGSEGSILVPGHVSNLGMTISGGQLKMTQASGSDLSSGTSKAQIAMPSAVTQGKYVLMDITAATHTLNDASHGTPQWVNEEYGATSGVAWGSPRPFFLYSCMQDSDAAVKFALCAKPNKKVAPATANIGYQGVPAATPSDNNCTFLTSVDPTTTFDGNPCVLIGGVRATMSTGDDWTFEALSFSNGDGISQTPFYGKLFTRPLAQNGAAAGSHIIANGGTAAQFDTEVMQYSLVGENLVRVSFAFTGNAVAGTGSTVQVTLPFAPAYSTSITIPVGQVRADNLSSDDGTFTQIDLQGQLVSSVQYLSCSVSSGEILLNTDFTDAAGFMRGSFEYHLD